MLFTLGLPREDVAESYGATLCLSTRATAIAAVAELIGSEYLFDRAIQGNFGTSVPFELDFVPLFGIAIASFFGLLLVFTLLRNWVFKRDFSREGR